MRKIRPVLALSVSGVLALIGCDVAPDGLGSVPLPGTQGRGEGAYTVTVQLANASDLYPNSRVMIANVDAGAVTGIRLNGWNAEATVSLNPDVNLPANVQARVGQTSLLGAKHLALDPPADEPPRGRLADGDTIPLSRSRNYPDTEDVLATVSTLLNGGGLQQVQTITAELNNALGEGRDEQVRQTLNRLDTFVGTLARQKDDINAALAGLDRLSGQAAEHNQVIEQVLTQLPAALQTLNEERTTLIQTLNSLNTLSGTATSTVDEVRGTLTRNLENLTPVLKGLADAGPALVGSTGLLATGLFPLKTNRNLFKGDYANLAIILDLTDTAISKYYLSLLQGTPLGEVVPGLGNSSGNLLTPPEGGKYEGAGGTGPLPAPPPEGQNPSIAAGGVNSLLETLLGGLGGGR
ncbi:MCE family protein [Amycolatopsis methanolica]|uniref:Virulence factor mce family protein n=1 Tax=Amycolatopsis methanolica 239 TaxID=1068978 RepID=A0A076N0Q6_AMYME|nr:MCE family protein [Amycolatopsis methanolica]AIJ24666.1 virulence factor mce family protein [Amycolatopsis methanolica 239]